MKHSNNMVLNGYYNMGIYVSVFFKALKITIVSCELWSVGLKVSWRNKRKIENRKTVRVYFTYVGKRFCPSDLHQVSQICNQSYHIWCWSVQYFRSRRGVNFAISQRINKSSLSHCSTAVLAGDIAANVTVDQVIDVLALTQAWLCIVLIRMVALHC